MNAFKRHDMYMVSALSAESCAIVTIEHRFEGVAVGFTWHDAGRHFNLWITNDQYFDEIKMYEILLELREIKPTKFEIFKYKIKRELKKGL